MKYFNTIMWRMTASFSIALAAMWAVYMLFDSVEHLRVIRAYKADYSRLADLALAHSPTALYQLAPLALLLSSSSVMLGLARSAELTALLAAGQTLKRRLAPFAVFSMIAVAASFALGEFIVPAAQSRYVELLDLEIKQKHTWGDKWRMDRQWFHGPSGFWHIGGRRDNDRVLSDVRLYRMSDDFSLEESLEIKRLSHLDDGKWLAEGLWRINPTDGKHSTGENASEIAAFPETPRHFEYIWRTADEMRLDELFQSAQLRRSQGLSDLSYMLARYMRLAYTALIFLLPLLSASIVWNRGFLARRPALWAGIGLSLGAGLLLFFALVALKSAAEAGLVPPVGAAFIPPAMELVVCLLSIRRIMT